MSTMHQDGYKILLPRGGPDHFWQLVHDHYAGESHLLWKYLAMLALRENAGWPLEHIGRVFNHPKGHVTRCIQHVKQDLRTHFQPSELPLPFDDPPPTNT